MAREQGPFNFDNPSPRIGWWSKPHRFPRQRQPRLNSAPHRRSNWCAKAAAGVGTASTGATVGAIGIGVTAFRTGEGRGRFCRRVRSAEGCVGARSHRAVSPFVNILAHTLPRCPPKTEVKMRVIIPTLVGLVALAATSVQAASVPINGHHHAKWHESPAQNIRKSQQYDYLVATNGSFRAYRMRKECGPIRDPELRASCVGSFGAYEPR